MFCGLGQSTVIVEIIEASSRVVLAAAFPRSATIEMAAMTQSKALESRPDQSSPVDGPVQCSTVTVTVTVL